MVESLLQICAKRVANCIYDGELDNLDWKLDEKLSNIVFEQFYEMDKKITEEDADEISNKLNVTKMYLNREDFDEIHQKMVFAQNLEQLHIDHLGAEDIFNFFNLDTDLDDEDDETQHDVIGVLKRLLNENSLVNLQKLHISTVLLFQPGWVKEMSQLLPNIKILDFYDVTQVEFIDICNYFTEITKFGILGRQIENLNGISNLKNLEFLDLSGFHFENEACLMELFELKKLRVLVLSGLDDDSLNIKAYLGCGKVLPELRIMDCSFNEIDSEMLEKLVETHPKLEMINLIHTSISRTPQLKTWNVKLLTEENLKCCMESLDHFSTDEVKADSIFESIREIVSEHFEEQTESDLRKLFNQLVLFIPKTINMYLVNREAIECLEEICRGDRMMMFDLNEREALINMLLFLSKEWFLDPRTQYEFHESLWGILNNDVLLDTKPEHVHEICERAAAMMVEGEAYGEEIFEDCLMIITKLIRQGQMKPERLLKLAKNWKLTKRLLRVLNSFDEARENFRLILDLVYKLHSIFPTKSIPRSREYIKTLTKNLKDYAEDTNTQKEILETLEEIMIKMNPIIYGYFFTEVDYEMILTLLSNKKTKESALYLLVILYYCTEEAYTENLEQLKEERVKDILKIIGKYKTVNDSDKFGMFQSIISTSKSQETTSWAKWILSHFEEFKEPRPKRRRMQ